MAKLFNTFTRAVVHQIGRDTGRVVSNSLYGDKHAIPIRRVGSSGREESFYLVEKGDSKIEMTVEEYRAMKEADGWKSKYLYLGNSIGMQILGWILKIILFIVCCFLPIIGAIIPLWMAISKFRKKNIIMFKEELMTVYVPDRRYSSGQRYAGHTMEKIEIKVPANKREKRILNIYGFIYLLFFVLISVLHTYILITEWR